MIKEQGSFVRECGETYNGGDSNRSYERGNRALGVVGTVLGGIAVASLWNRGGLLGGVLGGNGGSSPANVNINSLGGGSGRTAPTTFEVYSHECEDVLALTNTIWGQKVNTLELLAAQRNTDIAEKFGLYKSQIDADFALYKDNRDNIDGVNNRLTNELFSQYKYTRDKDDEIKAELSALKAQVAMNSAVRPYQDKLIQCEIDKALSLAINYTDKKTCKMITGVTVVPSTPTITGYGSYCCGAQAAEAAG